MRAPGQSRNDRERRPTPPPPAPLPGNPDQPPCRLDTDVPAHRAMTAEGVGFEPTRALALPVFKTWKAGDALQAAATICKDERRFRRPRVAAHCTQLHANWG